MKKITSIFLVAVLGGLVALGINQKYFTKDTPTHNTEISQRNTQFTALQNGSVAFDFVSVSELSTPSVVHIKTLIERTNTSNHTQPKGDFFDFFNDHGLNNNRQRGPQAASGSGVIITSDGYIVTNNHVINGASKIEVILNDKRSYIAELVGADPNTDLALLKISEKNLSSMPIGNSDHVKVGEWAVAVGNPFNLTSTVTAGIISAKGRSIDLLRSKGNRYAIENFIQTDAAVNPGNSGGALVNTKGELIGINTAIASNTGQYAGYSFAIPANIVKKVVADFKKYGKVQRAILGVSIADISSELAEEKKLKDLKGVYVMEVIKDGSADIAGIKKDDIILSIDNKIVKSVSSLQEEIAKHRPGDIVNVQIKRSGKAKTIKAKLLSRSGSVKLEKASPQGEVTVHGIKLKNLTSEERQQYGVKYGAMVIEVGSGPFKDLDIKKGYVITHIDKQKVYNANSAFSMLSKSSGGILIEGKGKDGIDKVYGLSIK